MLTRGYAITQLEDGTVLRSVEQVHSGDTIRVSLSDGEFGALVTNGEENRNG